MRIPTNHATAAISAIKNAPIKITQALFMVDGEADKPTALPVADVSAVCCTCVSRLLASRSCSILLITLMCQALT